MVICLEQDADLHMAQLMPLPLTFSCFSKIQIGFAFLVPADVGSPGKRAIKRLCVCVLEIVVFFGYISFAAVICCFVVSLQLHQNLVWILRRYYSPLRRVWCGRRWLRHDAAFRHRIWRHWGCAEVRRTRSYSLYYGRQSERCAGSRVYNGSSAVWPNHGRSIRAREARFAAVERRLPGPADRICPTAWPASAWCERNPWH